jgi:hypothetical protein
VIVVSFAVLGEADAFDAVPATTAAHTARTMSAPTTNRFFMQLPLSLVAL